MRKVSFLSLLFIFLSTLTMDLPRTFYTHPDLRDIKKRYAQCIYKLCLDKEWNYFKKTFCGETGKEFLHKIITFKSFIKIDEKKTPKKPSDFTRSRKIWVNINRIKSYVDQNNLLHEKNEHSWQLDNSLMKDVLKRGSAHFFLDEKIGINEMIETACVINENYEKINGYYLQRGFSRVDLSDWLSQYAPQQKIEKSVDVIHDINTDEIRCDLAIPREFSHSFPDIDSVTFHAKEKDFDEEFDFKKFVYLVTHINTEGYYQLAEWYRNYQNNPQMHHKGVHDFFDLVEKEKEKIFQTTFKAFFSPVPSFTLNSLEKTANHIIRELEKLEIILEETETQEKKVEKEMQGWKWKIKNCLFKKQKFVSILKHFSDI